MSKPSNDAIVNSAGPAGQSATFTMARQIAFVIAGSMLVALCARVSLPLPFTPVPLSLQNFGVLLVGLTLGSRAGFAALLLYLAEGAMGLPVFATGSLGLFGPTGGFLLAYPLVAFVAGWIGEHSGKKFASALAGSVFAEILLFISGIGWLMIIFHAPLRQAAHWGLYPFLAAEVAKVVAAAWIANRFLRTGTNNAGH